MTSENARRAIQYGLTKKRIAGVRMWANARQGNIVDPIIYETLGAESIRFTPLLQGLVGAWVMLKPSIKSQPAQVGHVGERSTALAIAPGRSPPLAMNGQQQTAPEAIFETIT